MNVTTYRYTRSQLRIQLGFFAVFAVLTVCASVYVLLHLDHGHLTHADGGGIELGSIAAFVTVVVAGTLVGSTRVDDHGIRVWRAWGRRSTAWREISSIEVVRDVGRGVDSFRVRVTLATDKVFKIPAPIHSVPYSGDPEFDAKVAEIRARWQAATGGAAALRTTG